MTDMASACSLYRGFAHYNDVSHIVYAILSPHLTSESASGRCPLADWARNTLLLLWHKVPLHDKRAESLQFLPIFVFW